MQCWYHCLLCTMDIVLRSQDCATETIMVENNRVLWELPINYWKQYAYGL
jgi:hypothetical protein